MWDPAGSADPAQPVILNTGSHVKPLSGPT